MAAGVFAILLVVGAHMFGGMRTPTANIEAAERVVIARVVAKQALQPGVRRLTLNIVHAPCWDPPRWPSHMEVLELGDHQGNYPRGEAAILPLFRAAQSPHRPADVAADAWAVEQAGTEVVQVSEDQLRHAASVVALLCGGPSDLQEWFSRRLMVMNSDAVELAGGAARDLLAAREVPRPGEGDVTALVKMMGDGRKPASLRAALVQLSARLSDDRLQQAAAERISADEDADVVASAVRGLIKRPDLVAARIPLALAGPFGAGRLAAARWLAHSESLPALALLDELAAEPSQEKRRAVCRALRDLSTERAHAALQRMRCSG
jgi:hypothetical protein